MLFVRELAGNIPAERCGGGLLAFYKNIERAAESGQ
jgi:hypothetical protein